MRDMVSSLSSVQRTGSRHTEHGVKSHIDTQDMRTKYTWDMRDMRDMVSSLSFLQRTASRHTEHGVILTHKTWGCSTVSMLHEEISSPF